MRLTDLSIRSLKAPDKGVVVYSDDTLTGFGVRVSQAGTKAYVLTHGVRRQKETIGRVGIITLAEARQEAKRRLSEYTLGKNKPRSIRWSVALDEYLSEVKDRRKESTYREYERLLKRHFRYGDTQLSDLSAPDLQASILRLSKSEGFHAFTAVRPFLNWAYRKHYLSENPMTLRLLTLPPSTNHIYGRSRGGVFMNERSRRAKEAIGWEARSQYHGKPLAGPLAVSVALYWPDRRKHDVDNIKVLLDACTGILWLDDGQIEDLRITKTFDKKAPRVELSAEPRL